jgi:heterodisulfide reductase subunit A
MGENKVTGVFLYSSVNGHKDAVDLTNVAAYAEKIPEVPVVWSSSDIVLSDVEKLASQITENKLKRIVIAGDMPGLVKSFFSRAMVLAGNKPDDVVLASFREHGATTGKDTERAKGILTCAVLGTSFTTVAVPEETSVNPDTLVIGGGIAGIQASLEIADGDNKVYLVEKTGTIGGHMAMFDKTFPTLDCAACILTPKMVEVGQHPNIDLMTYSEVLEVSGGPGNYKVKILNKARRVDLATCIGCGICAEKCPGKVASDFDAGTTLHKAIYIPFPQAVPNKYLIEPDACLYVKKGKCQVCVKQCPVVDCIDLDAKDKEIEVTVGNIVVATGFKVFDAEKAERFGYGKFPNVVTSLEFERLVNAAGPTEGKIVQRTVDKKGNKIFTADGVEPKSVALIHCVGSRDENHNKYCSKVCCMYSLKLAHLVKEKFPEADVSQFYIDMRAFGKGYEEFYNRIDDEGVNIIRGRTAKVEQLNGQLLLRSEDIEGDKLIEKSVDMVILAVGLEPRDDADKLGKMLGVRRSDDGWFMEANSISDPVDTFSGGISIAGVCQGPKDIPDTVAQASAAASRVLQSIVKGKIKKDIKDLTLAEIEAGARELSQKREEGKS